MNALVLMSFCLGNILGPLSFTSESSPEFIPAKITVMATCALSVILVLALRMYYVRENHRRDRLSATPTGPSSERELELADVTDRRNLAFRYAL